MVLAAFKLNATGMHPERRGSLGVQIHRLEDMRPASDLGFYEAIEARGRALVLGRGRTAEIGQPGLDTRVVQRLVERGRKLVDDVPRRPPRREHSRPDAHLIVDAGFL